MTPPHALLTGRRACPECGTRHEGGRFCTGCGHLLSSPVLEPDDAVRVPVGRRPSFGERSPTRPPGPPTGGRSPAGSRRVLASLAVVGLAVLAVTVALPWLTSPAAEDRTVSRVPLGPPSLVVPEVADEVRVPVEGIEWSRCPGSVVDGAGLSGRCVLWSFTAEGLSVSGPVASHRTVYVAANDRVHAMDATSGRQRWDVELAAPLDGLLAADRSTVLLNESVTGTVIALGEESGLERWRFQSRTEWPRGVATHESHAYVVTNAGRLHGLDLGDGNVRWSADLGDDRPSPPVADGDDVFVALRGTSEVVALDARDGAPRWRTVTGPVPGASDAAARGTAYVPVIDEATVYVVQGGVEVVAIDRADGSIRWRAHVEQTGAAPLPLGQVVLVGGQALDPETGTVRWATPLPGGVEAMTSDGETVYLGTWAGSLHAVDPTDGSQRWHLDLDVLGPVSPLALDPGVLTFTAGNRVFAVVPPQSDGGAVGAPSEDVWRGLARRRLRLPTHESGTCPTSDTADVDVGRAVLGDRDRIVLGTPVAASDGSISMPLRVLPARDRATLLRGSGIAGVRRVIFSTGSSGEPTEELRFLPGGHADPPRMPAMLTVPAPGCYVVQLDQVDHRDTVVFGVASPTGAR